MNPKIKKFHLVIFREPLIDVRGVAYGLSEGKSGIFIDFTEDYRTVIVMNTPGEIKRIPAENVRFLED
ncbi:MAG: hypothetical protein ABFD29_03865 [Anaerolineaceae bacterium]